MGCSWKEMFEKLKNYKEEFGHCRVPKRDGHLGSWVDRQRTLYRQNELGKEKVDALNSVGFVWQIRMQRKFKKPSGTAVAATKHDISFDEMLERLKEFQKEHGHCCVPQRYEEDRPLGLWVKNKRNQRRKGLLSADKIAKLNAIGFCWGVGFQKQNNSVDKGSLARQSITEGRDPHSGGSVDSSAIIHPELQALVEEVDKDDF